MATMLLDPSSWDLVLDANDNLAEATEPYSLAQDAASAILTFSGEVYWDDTIGVPYLSLIFGANPPLSLLKQEFSAAAETVPGVSSAQVFFTSLTNRVLTGQVQVSSAITGQVSVAPFTVSNPQGPG